MKNSFKHIMVILILLFSISLAQGNKNGKISGIVIDNLNGEPLIGANVMLKGTSIGASSNIEGHFSITNIPSGDYVLRVQYLGYEAKELKVTVLPNKRLEFNVKLSFEVIEGDEVIVTAQAVGQLEAINRQLASDKIVNVVSSDQIKELPDQNAAESIARLPGISVTRKAGEAQGVAIRGMAPKYNQIQIDGVPMSSAASTGSAGVSSLSQTRAVDLSLVSQENLQSIEVYKSITADMDANTLGGTVNMRLGKAPSKFIAVAHLFGSYNQQENDFKQYQAFVRASGRYFDDKLGIQLSLNSTQKNRGNDRLTASYNRVDVRDNAGKLTGETKFKLVRGAVSDERLTRKKHGLNAILDYDFSNTELLFSNFLTFGNDHSLGLYRSWQDGLKFQNSENLSNTYMLSNSLRATHKLSGMEIEWNISRYSTKTENEFGGYIDWDQKSDSSLSGLDLFATPEKYISNLPTDGYLVYRTSRMNLGHVSDIKYTGKIDFKIPFNLSKQASGYFKTGGLVKYIERESREEAGEIYGGRNPNGDPVQGDFATDYNPDPVLAGRTKLGFSLNSDKVSSSWDSWKNAPLAYFGNPYLSNNVNYDMTEKYYAGFVMLNISAFNNLVTFIPGLRYERADIIGDGHYQYIVPVRGAEKPSGKYESVHSDETFDYWLPMASLKIKAADWMDVRMSVTRTISRPDYIYRVPYETVRQGAGSTVYKGNTTLEATTSWNYDINASIYANKFGLLTVGLFYKEISNFSYMITHFVKDSTTAYKYGLESSSDYLFKNFSHPENTHGISTLKGFEIEYQANFHYLPGLLKNLVFRMNYTYLASSSFLRKYEKLISFSNGHLVTNYDTGYREGPMPTQPDYIANISVGYDIAGLSLRLSTFFQGAMLTSVGNQEENDNYVEPYNRMDFSLRYRFNEHMSIMANGVNITNTDDAASLHGTDKYSSYRTYGATYDFGFEYNF